MRKTGELRRQHPTRMRRLSKMSVLDGDPRAVCGARTPLVYRLLFGDKESDSTSHRMEGTKFGRESIWCLATAYIADLMGYGGLAYGPFQRTDSSLSSVWLMVFPLGSVHRLGVVVFYDFFSSFALVE